MITALSIWKGIDYQMVKNEHNASVSQWLNLNKESFKSLSVMALCSLSSFLCVSVKKIWV